MCQNTKFKKKLMYRINKDNRNIHVCLEQTMIKLAKNYMQDKKDKAVEKVTGVWNLAGFSTVGDLVAGLKSVITNDQRESDANIKTFFERYSHSYLVTHKNVCLVVCHEDTVAKLKVILPTCKTLQESPIALLLESMDKSKSWGTELGNTDIIICSHCDVAKTQQTSDPPLNATGIKQASDLGLKIKARYDSLQCENVNIILFASDLRKTQHTALIAAQAIVPGFNDTKLKRLLEIFNSDVFVPKPPNMEKSSNSRQLVLVTHPPLIKSTKKKKLVKS